MAKIPHLQKRPEPPPPPAVPTYTIEEMTAFGWLNYHPIALKEGGFAIPRTPDPRIPDGVDPRIPRKDETT